MLSSIEKIATKWKVTRYGQTSTTPTRVLECSDNTLIAETINIEICRQGGLGLDLVEFEGASDSSLVLLNDIVEGSNAAAVGDKLRVGDAVVGVQGGVATNPDKSKSRPLAYVTEGASLENILECFGQFSDFETIILKVKRLKVRNIVDLKVMESVNGENTEIGSYKILAGFGTNLRTLLQANNLNIYNRNQPRFDSPYQKGDCGGEGTCGTCVVAVLEGKDLLNDRARVEDKALRKQLQPNNYRWACRTQIAENNDYAGKITIKIKPQGYLYK